MTRTPIVLTCGDPAGIGSELAVKAWNILRNELVFFWIGDPRHLPTGSCFVEISKPSDAAAAMQTGLPVLPHRFAALATPGVLDPRNAQDVVNVIDQAVQLANTHQVAGICTAPIHKKNLQDGAAFQYPGHTEFLADLANVKDVVMMLVSPSLRVVPATIHIPLSEVSRQLTPALLIHTIQITAQGLKDHFKIQTPRIAVAGLNPHAGEGGKIGREDLDLITPILERLNGKPAILTGPHSADTLFHAAARQHYDAAIAMYHDQALIPIKTLDFDKGVNLTLGLPFIRTSPDHGTALDIAGRGIANPDSCVAALRLAEELGQKR